MRRYEESPGGKLLALAHKGNISNGIMFPVEEDNYIGKQAGTEPSPERWNHPMAKFASRH
jgi:hypothetical protein